MDFRPLDKTIRKIFDGDNTYKIPNFQREFSWEKKNYREFLTDLLDSMNITFKEEQGINYNEHADYFFGTILLVGNETNPKVEEPYIVVDGQQRLTTMTIFIAAVKSIIEEMDSSYLTSFSETLLVRYKRRGKELESARLQNKALEPVLPVNILNVSHTRENGLHHLANSESQDWLLESYEEFKKLLGKSSLLKLIFGNAKFYSKINDNEYIQLLESIGNQLLKSTVIAIYTPDEKSANIIYRNFNSRGVPLTNVDLIKNEIFSILDNTTESATTLWNSMSENIYACGTDMKKYLYHYMVFKKYVSTEAQVYDQFMKKVDATEKEYSNFLKDIHKKSEYYRDFINLPDNLKLFGKNNFFNTDNNFTVKKRLKFIKDTELEQVRILLLRLFDSIYKNKISSSNFKKILSITVKHQILHLIAKSSPNTLSSHYRKYIDKFEDPSTIKKEIIDFEEDFKKKIPSKEQLIKNIHSFNYSKGEKTKQIKETAILKQILIELSLNRQKDINKGNNGTEFIFNSTIEHINDYAKDMKFGNNLGNLLLLEQSKHFNNKPKDEMYEASDITMTKDFSKIVKEFLENEEKIRERSEELIVEFYDLVQKGVK